MDGPRKATVSTYQLETYRINSRRIVRVWDDQVKIATYDLPGKWTESDAVWYAANENGLVLTGNKGIGTVSNTYGAQDADPEQAEQNYNENAERAFRIYQGI